MEVISDQVEIVANTDHELPEEDNLALEPVPQRSLHVINWLHPDNFHTACESNEIEGMRAMVEQVMA